MLCSINYLYSSVGVKPPSCRSDLAARYGNFIHLFLIMAHYQLTSYFITYFAHSSVWPIPIIASRTVSPGLQRTATPELRNDAATLLCSTYCVPLVK